MKAIPSDHRIEELVRSAQQGSGDAFTALYEHFFPIVYNRVRYLVPAEEVEDIVQEIFIAAMKSLKNFRGEARFSTWLRTLVNREIADFYRRRKPAGRQADIDVESSEAERLPQLAVASAALEIDDSVLVRQALARLPERYREILMLRFADDLQFNEIAQVQGQSLEATKSLFRRAVTALQKVLVEEAHV
jgi:RNA polymerase sigma factor (sigma-70 family)